MTLNTTQEQLCEQSAWDFSDLHALFINCTLNGSGSSPTPGPTALPRVLLVAAR